MPSLASMVYEFALSELDHPGPRATALCACDEPPAAHHMVLLSCSGALDGAVERAHEPASKVDEYRFAPRRSLDDFATET